MIAIPIIVPALKKELGSFFSTEAHKDNDILRYINSAVRAIAIAKNFDWNQYKYVLNVTSDTTEYSVPYQIATMWVLKNWEPVDYENFIKYQLLSDKTEVLWIWGEKAECVTPWAYTILYRWYPSTATNLDSTIDIPEHFFDLILVIASYYGFLDIHAYDKATKKKEIFTWMIKSLATRSSDPQPNKTKRLNKSDSSVW